jgi:hypothetical protein
MESQPITLCKRCKAEIESYTTYCETCLADLKQAARKGGFASGRSRRARGERRRVRAITIETGLADHAPPKITHADLARQVYDLMCLVETIATKLGVETETGTEEDDNA